MLKWFCGQQVIETNEYGQDLVNSAGAKLRWISCLLKFQFGVGIQLPKRSNENPLRTTFPKFMAASPAMFNHLFILFNRFA